MVLAGLPGTGKSSTGRRLAKILCVPFADSDDLVEAAAGMTVAEVFERQGEQAFRELEVGAVRYALHNFDGVLALGGGALTRGETRREVRDSGVLLVALTGSLAALSDRVGDAASRPLLAGDPAGRLADLAAEREPVFREVAAFVVDTDGRTPSQVAAHIAARIHKLATP